MKRLAWLAAGMVFALFLLAPAPTWAGSIFLTGHDPDFHAIQGGNTTGARNINRTGINFMRDPAFNPYFASGIRKFLYVQSSIPPPGGHINGLTGVVASGFVQGVDFDHHTAATLPTALSQLGTTYSGIVVASDFGGILSQAELNILNARVTDIINFLNSGGGLYAMAEGNGGAHLTPQGGHFRFLPIVVSSTQFDQTEVGITVTPFGASLGLTNADVNGNASHNIFLSEPQGLQTVDRDRFGNILTLAGRTQLASVPEPGTLAIAGLTVVGLLGYRRWKTRLRTES